jgi:hypothetical protein
MKTRNEHLEFLRLNLVAVSACAWEGFQSKGRGAVCVMCDDHDEATGTVPFAFMPVVDAAKVLRPWEKSREEQMIANYDPRKEVVTIFIRSSGNRNDLDSYRFSPNPAPPIAEEFS